MMEMEKDTYIIDLQLCLVHDGRNNENETREETKLVVGSEADFSVVENSHSSQERMAEKEKKSKKKDFPSRLHEMLHESKAQGREHIISWDPDGKSFTVHQPEDFLAEVMPNYFKQTKYRSFQRMLNLYDFKKIIVGPMKGGYIHPKFLRDDKKLCNAIKLRNRASTRTPYKDSFRRAEVPKSATSSNSGCEDELWRPTNMPSEMTQPLTSIMGNRQLINPLFYRQENFALPVVKGKFSPCLDFLEQFTGQQQPEQEYWSSLPVASIIDHSICGPAWDVGMSYHPRLLTPTDARSNEQDFSNQSHTISFVGYERTFYEPLTDDLEPKQFPPRNFIMTGSRMIDLEVSNRLLPSPGVMGHGTCFDMELTNDIPSMCNNMSKASLYLDSF